MQNLIYFFRRYYHFFLFLLLEGIAFFFIVNYNSYQQAAFFNSSNQLTGAIYSTRNNITHYFSLGKVNQELMEDNARLRQLLRESYHVDTSTEISINDTILSLQYTYVPGYVIRNSVNTPHNFITINKGSNDGIKKNMGVINKDGVVGIITDVSANYSTAISVLNINGSGFSAKIVETETFGPLLWDGGSPYYAQLNEINKHAKIKEGQHVVSNTYSTIFPEGIPIGTIEEAGIEPGDNFYNIKVKLAVDFTSLTSVYIINNLNKSEIDSLTNPTVTPNE